MPRLRKDDWTESYRRSLIGMKVRLKGIETTIESTYTDIVGGVILADKVDGFCSWNLEDLEMKGPLPCYA